jgi:hypothetical protein
MRLNDIILEDEATDEGVLGGIVGAAKGLMKGSPVKGYQSGNAQSRGADQTKAQATALYKDFFNQMGQTGQAPSGKSLIDYLTKKQYPITKAKAVLNAAVPVRAQPQTPAQGNVPMVEPTLSPPIVPAATVPPSVLKPNPARGKPPVAEARGYTVELDANTAWRAILAATQENLRMGRNVQPSQNATNVGNMQSSLGSVNIGGGQPTQGMRPVATGQPNTPVDLQTVLNFYKTGLDVNGKIAFRQQLDNIDAELAAASKTSTPVAETDVGYSRFLGMQL